MRELLWLVPALPLAGFAVLAVAGGMLSRRAMSFVGVGSVGASAVIAALVAYDFLTIPPPDGAYLQTIYTWISISDFTPAIRYRLDALSLVMMLVVAWVAFLIHLYSAEFMEEDEGFRRYFAYMNLFVAAMLILVLADNLLFLYLGWEGVGLCSYLLIGFWYQDPANGLAARKAFVMTRAGDAAMAVGLFLLFTQLGTLDIQPVMDRAANEWPVGSPLAVAAAALLLAGAVGKSAQLPLQTWLPDAMAGPSPVSALIHAATMVTAGVYLIARTHELFLLAPSVQAAVAAIGALTLLLSAFSALTQRDIKRVLAYSTISQIGYMFLALGVGAWGAAIFHFMTHAFFKALLFLAAGTVIIALHHEHDIFKMGGLRKQLPLAFWSFVIGGSALAGLPLVTAGFYSKDEILWNAWASELGGPWLWAAGALGALLTGIYIFRLVFLVFFGEARAEAERRPGRRIAIPLVTLAALSVVGGFIEVAETGQGRPLFTNFLHSVLPSAPQAAPAADKTMMEVIASAISFLGIYVAYVLFLRRRKLIESAMALPAFRALRRFWDSGWAFDALYDRIFVRPFVRFARANESDVVDTVYDGIVLLARNSYGIMSRTQTGSLRWYAAGIAGGSIVVLSLAVLA